MGAQGLAGRDAGGRSLGRELTAVLGAAILLGLAVGLAVGTQGGGGSVLAVPILVYVLARHVRRRGGQVAEGVGRRQRRGGLGAGRRDLLSRRCDSPSLITLVTHRSAGRSIGVAVTVAMAGGAGAGELGGATVAGLVPQRTLGRGFAGLVVAVAAYLLVSATVLGGPPGS